MCLAELRVGSEKLFLISVYFPPKKDINICLSSLFSLLDSLRGEKIIISGDFNAKNPIWGAKQRDQRGVKVLELLLINDLHLLNSTDSPPTFESTCGKGWTDLSCVSGALVHAAEDWYVSEDISNSDHHYVYFTIRLLLSNCRDVPEIRYSHKRANWKGLREAFSRASGDLNEAIQLADTPEQVENITGKLMEEIKAACDNNLGRLKPANRRRVPWWNPHIEAARKKVRALRRLYQRSNNPGLRLQRQIIYKKHNASYKRLILEAKNASWEKFCETTLNTDPFSLPYKLAANKQHRQLEYRRVIKKDGNLTESLPDTMNAILEYLFPEDTAPRSCPKQAEMEALSTHCPDTEEDVHFTTAEIESVIKRMKKKKAPGMDGFTVEIIQALYQANSSTFSLLFNKCLDVGVFPRIWKTANVILFPKEGKPLEQPSSYRPICLLPVIGKILDKLITERIYHRLHKNNLLNGNQFGFLPGKSTTMAIYQLVNKIKENKNNNLYTAIISIDISSAFNTVWHPSLLYQLHKMECPRNLYQLVASYLRQREVILKCGPTTIKRQTERGCPQGSCSGPLYWNIVINDCLNLDLGQNVSIQAYADDIILIVSAKSRNELETSSNGAMNMVDAWCKENKLEINPDKVAAIMFTKKKDMIRLPMLQIQGTRIGIRKEIKYLGVILDNRLSWNKHLDHIQQKVTRLTQMLLRTIRCNWHLKSAALSSIYHQAIERMICYAAACWWESGATYKKTQKVLQIQRIPALAQSRAYRTTSTDALLVMCALQPINLVLDREIVVTQVKHLQRDATLGGHVFIAKNYEKSADIWQTHPADRLSVSWSTELPTGCEYEAFTDGSKDADKVGAAFCIYVNGEVTEEKTFKLAADNSIYQAELYAILQTVKWIRHNRLKSIRIYSDSQSSLQALEDPTCTNFLVEKIKKNLKKMDSSVDIQFRWVKSHVGVYGNERADRLAKKAAEGNEMPINLPSPISSMKTQLRTTVSKKWQQNWESSNKGRWTFRLLPKVDHHLRFQSAELVRIVSGHVCCPAYFKRIGKASSDLCSCGQTGDIEHYLFDCPLTEEFRPPDVQRGNNRETELRKLLHSKANRAQIGKLVRYLEENAHGLGEEA